MLTGKDDFQGPAVLLANGIDDMSIGAIGPDQFQATPAVVKTALDAVEQSLADQLAASPVLDSSATHNDHQQKTQRIDRDMAFSPWRLLMNIHTALLASLRGFDALAVEHRCAWLRISSRLLTHLPDEPVIDLRPEALPGPEAKIPIDRLPGRKVDRQHAPLATGSRHIQDGLDDLPHRPLSWSSSLLGFKVFRYQFPFAILQIRRVGLAELDHSPSLPDAHL